MLFVDVKDLVSWFDTEHSNLIIRAITNDILFKETAQVEGQI